MKRALLIGLNYTGSHRLNGCINDIHEDRALLKERGFTSFVELTDDGRTEKPTKTVILKAMKDFTSKSKPGELLAVFYSGHGGQCGGGKDEKDGMNECIYSCDFETIVDDDIKKALIDPLPEGVKIYLHFDSCHSGSVADLPFNYVIPLSRGSKKKSASFRSSVWDVFEEKTARSIEDASVMSEYTPAPKIKAKVLLLSGCKDFQQSADDFFERKLRLMQAEGAMTHFFREALFSLQSPTFYDILSYVNLKLSGYGYPQRPQMSGTDPTLGLLREKFWF